MAESELRQRRGGAADAEEEARAKRREEFQAVDRQIQEAKEKGEDTAALEEQQKQRLVDEIAQALTAGKPNRVTGLSNTAKQFKDQLAKDPFNMDLIFQLGLAYADDGQWDKVCNVMMRGWKRVGEIEDPATRYHFLAALVEASLRIKKYRQALAVLNDIEEPADEDMKPHYELMRCQVLCENGDMQKGMKALNKAIEGQDFDQACAIWANCLGPIKRAGAYELSKSTLLALATTDAQKSKLDAMEAIVNLKEEVHGISTPADPKWKTYAMFGFAAVWFAVAIYALYLVEGQSLAKLKLKS